MTRQARDILRGMGVSLVLLTLCVLIRPDGLTANDGLSYFGGLWSTVVPYSAAFLAMAYAYWQAAADASSYPFFSRRVVATGFRLMALLLLGLTLTPHTIVDPLHTFFGSVLFAFQLAVSFVVLAKIEFSWRTVGLVGVEFLAGITCFYYLPRLHGFLLEGELIFQLAFGLLLVWVLGRKSLAIKR